MLLSTSGKSPNLLRAAEAAAPLGVTTWALTGRAPNPLARACDEAVAIDGLAANAQECHLIALHAVCRAFDTEVLRLGGRDLQHGARP
jgi:D-sedoheptulose 7-phosphate isomerase